MILHLSSIIKRGLVWGRSTHGEGDAGTLLYVWAVVGRGKGMVALFLGREAGFQTVTADEIWKII